MRSYYVEVLHNLGTRVTIYTIVYDDQRLSFGVAIDGGPSETVEVTSSSVDRCRLPAYTSAILSNERHTIKVTVPSGMGNGFNFRRLLVEEDNTTESTTRTSTTPTSTYIPSISTTTATTSHISTITVSALPSTPATATAVTLLGTTTSSAPRGNSTTLSQLQMLEDCGCRSTKKCTFTTDTNVSILLLIV
jgi:hypothetical protein